MLSAVVTKILEYHCVPGVMTKWRAEYLGPCDKKFIKVILSINISELLLRSFT